MTTPSLARSRPPMSRPELQKDQPRRDLALAAFELAREHGLAGVRGPQIAAATGVSPRTFHNYFPSKEAAIACPATQRGVLLAAALNGRPATEPLAEALAEATASMYRQDGMEG